MHITLVKLSNCCSAQRNSTLYAAEFVASEQPRPQSR